METFPGPNFFTWQSYVARVPSAPKGSLTLILPTASCRGCDAHSSLRRYLRAPALLITARRHHDSQRH